MIYCLFLIEIESLQQDTHKLKGKEFIVKIVDENCSNADECKSVIEVSGYTEPISKDILEVYFESKKSGGRKETIESVSIISKGKALLTFNNSEGAYK